MSTRKRRTYFQQVAAAVKFEKKLNATLIKVTREHNKANFTFKHNTSGKTWRTTLSKLENYGHDNLNKCTLKKNNYWAPKEWEEAAKKSNHYDSFKIYLIKCTFRNETFFKIGRTFNTIEKRFLTKDFGYSYEVIEYKKGSASYICSMENKLIKLNKPNQYIPNQKFSGMYECFSTLSKETYAYFK